MKVIKQISSLEKVCINSSLDYSEITQKTVLKGERFSYQIAIGSNELVNGIVEIDSELKEYIKVFVVDNAVMDLPFTEAAAILETDIITTEPGLMPDILVTLEERDNFISKSFGTVSLWIEVNIPENIKAGNYRICTKLRYVNDKFTDFTDEFAFQKVMNIEVADKAMAKKEFAYTRWFYADCIADYHNVEVYSPRHWELIEKYITAAVDSGVNMILVPVHTPPLDTAPGTQRTCVQLVDIKKVGDNYTFEFDKFRKFVDICKKCGVKYFEIAHMFSQWGAAFAPNIMVEENGVKDYMFGWHVAADSREYTDFLKQYIAAIAAELDAEGISENTYFHISDEPTVSNMDGYAKAHEIIKPLIGNAKCFDALSNVEFYEKGLVECPVTCVNHMADFLKYDIPNQWAYYCCVPQAVYTNSILAMPSSRVRIIGLLMYKYNIKGFLHWGLNFYRSRLSRTPINPYATTSAGGVFPSGDPFILYPAPDGAYSSIRGKVMYEAIEDMNICYTLEQYIGKEEVVKIIDALAGFDITFDNYPKGKEYLEAVRKKITEMIKNK